MPQTVSNLNAPTQTLSLLSHLLPYDPVVKTKARLKDGLKEHLFLLIVAEEAIKRLKEGNPTAFDPLVGENACQIRAIKIASIANDCFIKAKEIIEKINSAKNKINEILSRISNFSIIEKSLKDYLEEELDIPLNSDEIFLIAAYILTRTKVTKSFNPENPLVKNDTTTPTKIREISEISSLFSKNLTTSLRGKIAASSVSFIQEIAKQMDLLDPTTEMVLEKYSIFHNKNLKCIPCYWTARALVHQAFNKQIPLVLLAQQMAKDQNFATIEKTALFFEATQNGYCSTSQSSLDKNKLALILFGNTCRNYNDLPEKEVWIKELLKHSPTEILLAYAAAHRQYPDESKDVIFNDIQDPNYIYHKTKAEEWGCSLKNPSLFFLAHAYCDKIGNLEKEGT